LPSHLIEHFQFEAGPRGFDQRNLATPSTTSVAATYQTQERSPETIRKNEELATKYRVQEFPAVVVLSPNGQELGRLGYIPGGPKAFGTAVKTILAKSRPPQEH
jgi:thioredoxin-related protein